MSQATGLDTNEGLTLNRPVASIGQGLMNLSATGRQTLAIVSGQYTHQLRFSSGTVRLVGIAANGARLCNPMDFPRITSPTPTGLEVTGGVLSVEQVHVVAAAGTLAQRSSSGALVSGGTVSLVDVTLEASTGASGAAPAPALAPMMSTCDGFNDCSDGGTGLGGGAGAPSDGGSFGTMGFLPGAGSRGLGGGRGFNGTASVAQSYGNCVSSCTGPTPCTGGDLFCGAIGFDTRSATRGACGCGGTGANPGEPGTGGGASIALVVTGTGSVTMSGGLLISQRGGNGAPGGAPSAPLSGGTGTAGMPETCVDFGAGGPTGSCARMQCTANCVPSGPIRTLTATPGGRGGTGGPGGPGGGGSGGPSIGWVRVGSNAMVTVSPQTSIARAAGGTGANGARDGLSASQLVWP